MRPDEAAQEAAGDFFDVERLLEHSRPVARSALTFLPIVGMTALLGAFATSLLSRGPVGIGVSIGLLGVSIGCIVGLARMARSARDERGRVRSAEELVALRHWPQAASALKGLLADPMRMAASRRAALLALAKTLSRYGLFDEAVDACDEVLDDPGTDPSTRFAVGCGRAMILLQSGRLGDANDAIDRLRGETRQINAVARRMVRAREEADADQADVEQSDLDDPDAAELSPESMLNQEAAPPPEPAVFSPAALTLVSLYRDIQTRHDAEAIELFEAERDDLRQQLGLRLGDGLALAGVAAARLDRPDDAARLWHEATLLQDQAELRRRYPEVEELAGSYPAASRPDREERP
jgi:hypothetical protein